MCVRNANCKWNAIWLWFLVTYFGPNQLLGLLRCSLIGKLEYWSAATSMKLSYSKCINWRQLWCYETHFSPLFGCRPTKEPVSLFDLAMRIMLWMNKLFAWIRMQRAAHPQYIGNSSSLVSAGEKRDKTVQSCYPFRTWPVALVAYTPDDVVIIARGKKGKKNIIRALHVMLCIYHLNAVDRENVKSCTCSHV